MIVTLVNQPTCKTVPTVRLGGLVGKTSTSRAADVEITTRFPSGVIPVTNIGIVVAALRDAQRQKVRPELIGPVSEYCGWVRFLA